MEIISRMFSANRTYPKKHEAEKPQKFCYQVSKTINYKMKFKEFIFAFRNEEGTDAFLVVEFIKYPKSILILFQNI
jgi:hypothetical protein